MSIPGNFEFNEIKNVLCSIELCAELVERIQERPANLKWLIIATHDMLQGALVCALNGSDNTGALTKASQKQFFHLTNIRRSLISAQNSSPEDQNLARALQELEKVNRSAEKLADFKELLKRAQNTAEKPLELTNQEKEHLGSLNDLRNEFMHFRPATWDIETTKLPQIFEIVFEATEHLMTKQEVWPEENIRKQIKSGLSKLRSSFKKYGS